MILQSKKNNVTIIIATHKRYLMPDDSELYLPIQVGAAGKKDLGYCRDDVGENISDKNPYFCELTGLYWAWKNLDSDYIGLVHYRRYFTLSKFIIGGQKEKFNKILNRQEAYKLLEKSKVILPNMRHYYIENLYDHYKHTMYVEPLDITRDIILEKYPEYIYEFDNLHRRTSAHMFNMFIMEKNILNNYCNWLFTILFELENRVDNSLYDSFHQRFYGRISELLLDVYIYTNKISFQEVRVIDMENINWLKKGTSFLNAKFFGEKYDSSF